MSAPATCIWADCASLIRYDFACIVLVFYALLYIIRCTKLGILYEKNKKKGTFFLLVTDKIGINGMYGLEWTKGKEGKNEEFGYALLECVAHG